MIPVREGTRNPLVWMRGDVVKLTVLDPGFPVHVLVVASDTPDETSKLWTIAVHDDDWTKVGKKVSTKFVERHSPTLLLRVGDEDVVLENLRYKRTIKGIQEYEVGRLLLEVVSRNVS